MLRVGSDISKMLETIWHYSMYTCISDDDKPLASQLEERGDKTEAEQ